MKKVISLIAFIAIATFVFTSCTSKHGMAYNKHLRNNGKCLISSDGCGWSK